MKLTTLVSPLTLCAMLALGGCKKEQAASPAPTSAAAAPSGSAPRTGDTAQPAAASTAAVETAAPEPMAGVPAACTAYKAGIDRLATCETLSAETREVLKQAFDQATAGWAKDPDKDAVADACQRAAEALKQVEGACL